MVKASVFPGTPRAGYADVRHCKKTGPVRTATAVPCRHASSRQRRHLYCACAAPTKGPCFHASSTGHRPALVRQDPHARSSCRPQGGAQKRAESTPRARKTHRDSVVTPRFVIHAARPGNEDGGSARRRHFPHASAQPRPRLAPSTPFSPVRRKILAAQTFSEHPSL